jgi:hypothetical protein
MAKGSYPGAAGNRHRQGAGGTKGEKKVHQLKKRDF